MSKEVATKEVSFPALTGNPKAIMAAVHDNLGGQELTAWDLDRIKVPSGGGLAWTVPGLDGPKPEQFVQGVIIYVQNARAYWATSFDASGGGAPPDCVSEDGITGVGIPGGQCKACPYAKFGSNADGVGQACKAIRRLFMLRPDEMLPFVVVLPPTSLKSSKKYLLTLASHGLNVTNVVTKIGLEGDKSKAGITYSKATFAKVGDLPPEMAVAANAWKELMRQAAGQQVYEDFEPPNGGPA